MTILDVPEYDGGGNFGRLSRVPGLTTEFVAAATAQEALGIPVDHWINFLKLHSDSSDPELVTANLLQELTATARARSEEDARQVLSYLSELVRLLSRLSSGPPWLSK